MTSLLLLDFVRTAWGMEVHHLALQTIMPSSHVAAWIVIAPSLLIRCCHCVSRCKRCEREDTSSEMWAFRASRLKRIWLKSHFKSPPNVTWFAKMTTVFLLSRLSKNQSSYNVDMPKNDWAGEWMWEWVQINFSAYVHSNKKMSRNAIVSLTLLWEEKRTDNKKKKNLKNFTRLII